MHIDLNLNWSDFKWGSAKDFIDLDSLSDEVSRTSAILRNTNFLIAEKRLWECVMIVKSIGS